MSIRGIIARPDKAPLGDAAQIRQQLADAFPGVTFTYEAEEPVASKRAGENMSLFLRIWLGLFGVDGRYPNYKGVFTREQGGIIEFYFEATEPIKWISATCYGRTGGLDEYFNSLARRTGWTVRFP